jgi:two-component system, chemotaxis family, chemotaxis protein CheY
MIDLDDELAEDYLAECYEHVSSVEADLLTLQNGGAESDLEFIDRAFRALHWMQGAAGLFELGKIGVLARQMEHVLGLMRSGNLAATPARIAVLLGATDRLRDLIREPGSSNQADIAEIMAALMMLDPDRSRRHASDAEREPPGAHPLRMLLVEDDFASRLLLQTFLAKYGEFHVAVNGREAVEAFRWALERGQRYDLICMDIMMPEMDGREAVRRIRALEEEHGILSTSGAKIVMTTAVDDVKEVIQCFHELCDSYLTKPIDLGKLLGQMREFQLIAEPRP